MFVKPLAQTVGGIGSAHARLDIIIEFEIVRPQLVYHSVHGVAQIRAHPFAAKIQLITVGEDERFAAPLKEAVLPVKLFGVTQNAYRFRLYPKPRFKPQALDVIHGIFQAVRIFFCAFPPSADMIERICHFVVPAAVDDEYVRARLFGVRSQLVRGALARAAPTCIHIFVENDGKRIAISDFDADRAAVFRDVFDDALQSFSAGQGSVAPDEAFAGGQIFQKAVLA